MAVRLSPGGTRTGSQASGYVYWTNNNTIGRANLDGTGVSQRFLNAHHHPGGVAVDARRGAR